MISTKEFKYGETQFIHKGMKVSKKVKQCRVIVSGFSKSI